MKVTLISFVLVTCSLAAQTKDTIKNYYWINYQVALSSYYGGAIRVNLGANVSIKHHLFSATANGYITEFLVLGGSSDPRLFHFDAFYGYIEKHKYWFYYAKSGLSVARYEYVTSITPGSGWFGFPDYHFSEKYLVAIPIEVGINFSLKLATVGACAGFYLGNSEISNAYVGLKLGSGNFR